MTWLGPDLTVEQRDLAAMLDDFADSQVDHLTDEAEVVEGLTQTLANLGVWTLGASEASGGGGADRATTVVAWERIARRWPALALASVQAHAALEILAGDERFADIVAGLHAGTSGVAVVDGASGRVHLTVDDDRASGCIDRVDVAAAEPHLLILQSEDRARFVRSADLRFVSVSRTGLDGAMTCAISAHEAPVADVVSTDCDSARIWLRLGITAVAAGIAGASFDAAARYTSERQQFGGPLNQLPTVRMALLAQAGRTASAVTTAISSPARPTEALTCAQAACDAAIEVAASALQCHGGYGYLTEYPVERYLRDAVSLRAAADLVSAAGPAAAALAAAHSVS